MTVEQMRIRALARNELRQMLAAFRDSRGIRNLPSLVTRRRAFEESEIKFAVFCGKDEDESAAIATEMINYNGFRQFIRRNGASYQYVFDRNRTSVEIMIP